MNRTSFSFVLFLSTLSSMQLAACGGLVGSDSRGGGGGSNDTTPNPSSSGNPGSSTTPASCPDAHIAVDGEPNVVDIALDAQYVYLLEHAYPESGPATSAVRRVSRCGGAITTFAESPQNPVQIAIDDENIYWVTSNVGYGGTDVSSALSSISKTGNGQTILRSSATASGAIAGVTLVNGSLAWIEAGALQMKSGIVAPVANAKGKIVASGNYVFAPEYDDSAFTFDVRRVDVTNPNAPTLYRDANATAAMTYFEGNLYVDGLEDVMLATPKGSTTSAFGPGFSITTNATDVFVTYLQGGNGNALFRVKADGTRALLDQGGALGPTVMIADTKAVAWTDGSSFHLTPL